MSGQVPKTGEPAKPSPGGGKTTADMVSPSPPASDHGPDQGTSEQPSQPLAQDKPDTQPQQQAKSQRPDARMQDAVKREVVAEYGEDRNRILVAGDGVVVYAYSNIKTESFAGRDSTGSDPGGDLFVAKVRSDHMKKLTDVYAAPRCEEPARKLLGSGGLIGVRGPDGSGRTTLAIQLLRELAKDQVWQIRPHTSIAELSEAKLEEDRGYMLSMSPRDTAAEFDLARLRSICEERKCYLVLIGATERSEFSADVPVFDVAPPETDRITLLRRHVKRQLAPETDSSMETVLARPEVASWCLGTHRLAEIDTVASIVRDVVGKRISIDALGIHLNLADSGRIRAWFENPEQGAIRPLTITLSFFGGLPLQTVLELENRLTILLRTEAGETQARDLFADSSRVRLSKASVHVGFADHDDIYGTVRTQIVEFANRTWEASLAQLLRTDYPQVRSVIVTWLRECAEHPDAHVQRRAALMLGTFAEDNLPMLLRDVIGPWSLLPEQEAWPLVVWALTVPLAKSETAPRVSRMLEQWADSGNRNLASMAAMVYGLAVASANPSAAVRGLAHIARRQESPEDDWATSAAAGVVAMYMSNLDGLTQEVLGALRKWTSSKKKTERELALLAFTVIADTIDYVAGNDTDARGDGTPGRHGKQAWPSLLFVAKRAGERADVIALWRIALSNTEWSRAALGALRRWFNCANDRPYLVKPLTQFVPELATTPEEADRLAYHLRSWAKKNPKGAAAQVYRALHEPVTTQ